MNKQMTRGEIKQAGLVIVGEWGFPCRGSGFIVCNPKDLPRVQAAYDAIEDGDMGSDVLDGVKAAGESFVKEA